MIKLLYAALGTLGFGMIFNANKNKLIFIMLGGLLGYLGYYITDLFTSNIFIASAVCASVTSTYAYIMARLVKCPSTVFLLPGLIPIVPGGSLFYMMENLVLGDSKDALNQGIITVEVIFGIVSGILFVSTCNVINKEILKTKEKKGD